MISSVLSFSVGKEVSSKNATIWDITPVVRWKSTDVSEEYIASSFGVEE
jgi:predicted RNA-binding protein